MHHYVVEPYPRFSGVDLDEDGKTAEADRSRSCRGDQPAGAIYFMLDEKDVQRILAFGETMIGSDGLPHDAKPHPRLWGTFPRVLGHYSRDLELFPLETAVYKMTGLTARKFGLEGRGVLAQVCMLTLRYSMRGASSTPQTSSTDAACTRHQHRYREW